MKTIVPFALSFLFALPAFAQESAYVDLYSTKDFSTPLWAADGKTTYFKYQWVDEEKQKSWWQTESGAPTIPGANNNLWVIADTTSQTGIVSGYGNVPLEIHDLNYVLKVGSPGFELIGGADVNINMAGNLNITLEESYANWSSTSLNIVMGGGEQVGNTYHVYGDMNVLNKAAGSSIHQQGLKLTVRNNYTSSQVNLSGGDSAYYTTAIQKNCTFQVDGDLTFSQTSGYSSTEDLDAQKIIFQTSVTNFIVGGVVDMTSLYANTVHNEYLAEWNLKTRLGTKAETLSPDAVFDSNITIGGLKGNALLSATEDYDAANHKINMTFTNKTDAVWQGTFKNDGGTQFHLKMDSSATNSQTMVFSDKSATNSATGLLVDSVGVSGGTLLFQNQSSYGNGELVLDGGKFGALGDGASFASAVLKSGALLIGNKDSFSAGIYSLNLGALAKEGTEKIGIDFDGFDAAMFIDEPAYTLIFCESPAGFSSDANDDFIAQNLLGALANFAWDGNMLTVSFSQVPEPAAAAALLGALALGLAALRRRK